MKKHNEQWTMHAWRDAKRLEDPMEGTLLTDVMVVGLAVGAWLWAFYAISEVM